jgi:hypothetical protein
MQSFDNVRIGVHHELMGIDGGEQSSIIYSEEDSKEDGAEFGRVLVNNHNN